MIKTAEAVFLGHSGKTADCIPLCNVSFDNLKEYALRAPAEIAYDGEYACEGHGNISREQYLVRKLCRDGIV